MRILHARSWLARLVVAWHALTLCAAMASPLVQPQSVTQVCSADGGMVLVVLDADGEAVTSSPHTLDCALCLATALPAPAAPPAAVPSPNAFAPALPPVAHPHGVLQAGAPLPARGPPLRAGLRAA